MVPDPGPDPEPQSGPEPDPNPQPKPAAAAEPDPDAESSTEFDNNLEGDPDLISVGLKCLRCLIPKMHPLLAAPVSDCHAFLCPG